MTYRTVDQESATATELEVEGNAASKPSPDNLSAVPVFMKYLWSHRAVALVVALGLAVGGGVITS